jgi:ADP-heptose:LPS heptosyltransferase
MFEALRFFVGLSYARLHFRRRRDAVMRFTEAIERSQRALVLLPETAADSESMTSVVKYLHRRLGSGNLTIIGREEYTRTLHSSFSDKTISYTQEEINGWFLPRGRLLRKMKSSTFDMALDLNVNLALPSAFICRESGAPLRVGFAKPEGDRFYNFVVQTRMTTNTPVAYKHLLKCLDMF